MTTNSWQRLFTLKLFLRLPVCKVFFVLQIIIIIFKGHLLIIESLCSVLHTFLLSQLRRQTGVESLAKHCYYSVIRCHKLKKLNWNEALLISQQCSSQHPHFILPALPLSHSFVQFLPFLSKFTFNSIKSPTVLPFFFMYQLIWHDKTKRQKYIYT